MARSLLLAAVAAVALVAALAAEAPTAPTAADVVRQVYAECLQRGSLACVRPRLEAFLAADPATIRITRDLALVPSAAGAASAATAGGDSNALDADVDSQVADGGNAGRRDGVRQLVLARLEAVERFLRGHEVRVVVPQELTEAVPEAVRDALPRELRLPLDPDSEASAQPEARHRRRRGFLKKVVLPFILGLKFKTTVLIPLALSLIALKTWKALTLGLLSLVLSGAMVIFRFTKPKVVNYDVYHYPQPHAHYEHHVDHHPGYDHAHYDHYDHHSYAARSSEVADDLAYSAHAAHQP